MRILVVDDEALIRTAVARQLCALGYSVETASGLRDAIAVAKQFRPEAVISDIQLEDGLGFDVVRALRTAADCRSFALFTGQQSARVPDDLRDVPLLSKPCAVSDILAALALPAIAPVAGSL